MDKYVEVIQWLFTIIGVIAAIYEFVGFYQQKKLEKPYEEAFKQFSQNLEGKYTQEQIGALKQELRKLESQIENDIPSQARKEFLENQKDEVVENINHLYGRYLNITDELRQYSSENSNNLSPTIIKVINEGFASDHLPAKVFQQKALRLLAIILTLIIILNFDVILSIIPAGSVITISNIDYPIRWVAPFIAVFFIIGYFWNVVLSNLISKAIKKHLSWFAPLTVFGFPVFLATLFLVIETTGEWADRCNSYGIDCFHSSNILGRLIFTIFSSSVATISILPFLHIFSRILKQNRFFRSHAG